MSVGESTQLALTWYLTITVIAAVGYPILYRVATSLPDRGLTLTRPAGILILFLPFWVIGHITGISLNRWSILALLLCIGIVSWLPAIRSGEPVRFLRERWRRVLLIESVTFLVFALYLVFRGFNPDISGTEKPMELAFLNSVIGNQSIPTPDPWFAGEPINYYYLGYVILGGIGILTGIAGETVFNLSLAIIVAMSVVAAAGMSANLVERAGRSRRVTLLAAMITGYLLGIAGNLHAASQVISRGRESLADPWWSGFGWQSSRVIEDTGFPGNGTRTVITEFPAFSWILGDLHPHVITLPWMLLAVALLANLYLAGRDTAPGGEMVPTALASGVAVGALFSLNTWDIALPLVGGGSILLVSFRNHSLTAFTRQACSFAAGVVVAAVPFALRYDPPSPVQDQNIDSGNYEFFNLLGYVSWNRTGILDLVSHWGAFLFILIPLSILILVKHREALRNRLIVALGLFVPVQLIAVATTAPALSLYSVAGAGVILLISQRSTVESFRVAGGLILAALIALTAVEFVFLRDVFGDRMNTVFKFGFQAWALLAIGTGALIPYGLTAVSSQMSRTYSYVAAGTLLVVVILSTAIYTPAAAYRWSHDLSNWQTLDGVEYINEWHPDELAAAEWLRMNRSEVTGVVESPACAYGADNRIPHSRISMMTGIPTVIGWEGHQFQWRRGQPDRIEQISERVETMNLAYLDPEEVQTRLRELDISHVVYGVHERLGYQQCEAGPPYPEESLRRLDDAGWSRVFESGEVVIYEISRADAEN